MRLLYGVVGEGMGHALRSRVVLEHLVARGHQVEVMASGRAVDYLRHHFPSVRRIHGLHLIYGENRVRRGKTLWSNVLKGAKGVPRNISAYFELVRSFAPELVVSDFESWTYLYARRHGLPVVSIDNMQILSRARHPPEIIGRDRADFEIARAFVRSKLPDCDQYLIATFFRPEEIEPRTSLHPPLLREEVLAARPTRGDHLLVYQTAEGHEPLTAALRGTGLECRVYGMRRGIRVEQVEGNIRHRPFSDQGFIDDLASARAVVAGGGFTLMSEAVYLHKPMLALPLGHQFEQILNARWLERLGYGRCAAAIDEPGELSGFLADLPDLERALASYRQDGNRELLEALDGHLARLARTS